MKLTHPDLGLPNALRYFILFIGCFGFVDIPSAQTSSNQFWPELDSYFSITQKTRLKFVVSRSNDGNSYNSIEIGPTINFFARRFVKPRLKTLNSEKDHLLTFGIGYRYLAGIDQAPENRVEFDFKPQVPLPWKMQLANRNRIDLRFIQGSSFSWRYRNLLFLQRSFKMGRLGFSPYGQVEVFYSSSSASWNKATFQAGVDIPAGKHFDFQPYYERDHNVTSTPNYVNAIGVATSIYF
jgi:hypothetical protein